MIWKISLFVFQSKCFFIFKINGLVFEDSKNKDLLLFFDYKFDFFLLNLDCIINALFYF